MLGLLGLVFVEKTNYSEVQIEHKCYHIFFLYLLVYGVYGNESIFLKGITNECVTHTKSVQDAVVYKDNNSPISCHY